ncbi:DUF3035 domain-containing protein [Acidocella sp.]|uniref:DUF3035 domain-containing protein n=1 Tax=Acidocella sp. TaxID=50710 RepID=UPI0026398698|nr:DUF3035 domain-containing protein [Acidocella sp.]
MTLIRPARSAALTLAAATLLAGCSHQTKQEFGLEANPPDAFDVGTEPPLSLPPELGQLPAPNPGQAPTQQQDAATLGENTLVPGQAIGAPTGGPSAGAQALLNEAGPTPPADIREQVNQNALVASRPAGFVGKLEGQSGDGAQVVDASAEAKRLQQNEALGLPVTQGETPQQPAAGKPGFWHKLLNFF